MNYTRKDSYGWRAPLTEFEVYGKKWENSPPDMISLLYPEDGATNISPGGLTLNWNINDLILNWTASDPDGDSLYFDLYLSETDHNLVKIASGLMDTIYTVNNLEFNKTYNWQVIVSDPYGEIVRSDVYNFSTINLKSNLLKVKIFQSGTETTLSNLPVELQKTYPNQLFSIDTMLSDATGVIELNVLEGASIVLTPLNQDFQYTPELIQFDSVYQNETDLEFQALYKPTEEDYKIYNYPNPAGREGTNFKYFTRNRCQIEIEIFDMSFQKIKELSFESQAEVWGKQTLDLSSFADGVYIYQARIKNLTTNQIHTVKKRLAVVRED